LLVNKQQIDNIELFKKNYYDYYFNHIRAHETQSNLHQINSVRKKNYELSNQVEKMLSEGFNPIHKILFILRRNFSYQLKLIELAEEKNEEYILETLADLFSNRFYENILIQNAENQEFIILLFYLFKQEIDSMHNASLSSFLDEETKFIGKLLRLYTSRSEFKSFLRMTFNEYIMKIQNQHPNIEIDTKVIFNYVKAKYSTLQINSQNNNQQNLNTSRFSTGKVTNGMVQNNGGISSEKNSYSNCPYFSSNKIENLYDGNILLDTDSLGKSIKRSSLLLIVFF
jgi:hypothetical protein